MRPCKLCIAVPRDMFDRSFLPEDQDALRTLCEVVTPFPPPHVIHEAYLRTFLPQADICLTGWGTPNLDPLLSRAPSLQLILHAGGSHKAIAGDAAFARGIRVATAANIIAADVAETALGAIIFMRKQLRSFDALVRSGAWGRDVRTSDALKPRMHRLNGFTRVGIVGASQVGRHLIRYLSPFGVQIFVYDPYLSSDDVLRMGVTPIALDTLFSSCEIVSCHAPLLPDTRHLVGVQQLRLLAPGALFVNTARGACVDEAALIAQLQEGRISAYLDVFEEEPLPEDSPLRTLDNVLLSPHIAGGHSVNGGYERGRYMLNQLRSYLHEGFLQDEVHPMKRAIMA